MKTTGWDFLQSSEPSEEECRNTFEDEALDVTRKELQQTDGRMGSENGASGVSETSLASAERMSWSGVTGEVSSFVSEGE